MAQKYIIEEDLLLDNQLIIEEKIRIVNLNFIDNLQCIEWLAQRRLLHNSYFCEKCNIHMSFIRRSSVGDGYSWKCRLCKYSVSIRKDSFFSRSNMPLNKILLLIYLWVRDYPPKKIAYEADVGENSPHTVIYWCTYFRGICEQYYIDHPHSIGGVDDNLFSKVVEIDETKFYHRKFNHSQCDEGHWVFGGIERKSGKCFLIEVPDRTEETLTEIIERCIKPGTIIMSDKWEAYRNINRIQEGIYEHQVVSQKQRFKDSEKPHIKHMEGMWLSAKCKLRKQTITSETLFSCFLTEFLWKKQFNENVFGHFLICIAEQYTI